MEPKCECPFEIEEVLGPVTYRLKLPITWQIHNVFLPCNLTQALYQKQNLWQELYPTSSRDPKWQRSLWSKNHPETQKTRPRISILGEMDQLSNYRSNLGTRKFLFRWWQPTWNIQTMQSTLIVTVNLTVNMASIIRKIKSMTLFSNLKAEEQKTFTPPLFQGKLWFLSTRRNGN